MLPPLLIFPHGASWGLTSHLRSPPFHWSVKPTSGIQVQSFLFSSRARAVHMRTWQRVPNPTANTSLPGHDASRANLTTRYHIFPSVIAFIAALWLASTAITSVALTYAWQTKWRKLDRLPFISEAHYDDTQSPIFSTMTAATAFCSLLTVIATFVVTHDRIQRQALAASRTAGHTDELDGVMDESLTTEEWVSNGDHVLRQVAVPLSSRLTSETEAKCAKSGLICGCTSSLLLFIAAAISAKMPIHMIFARSSFVTTTFWSTFVNITLGPYSYQETLPQRLCRLAMWLCNVVQFACLFSIFSIVDQTTSLIVIVEYITVAASTIFVFLLSFRLAYSRIQVFPSVHETESG